MPLVDLEFLVGIFPLSILNAYRVGQSSPAGKALLALLPGGAELCWAKIWLWGVRVGTSWEFLGLRDRVLVLLVRRGPIGTLGELPVRLPDHLP